MQATGTQAAILSLIDEWQRSGYTADLITKKVQKAGNKAAQHIAELAQIFSAYQKALKDLNYTDQHGLVLQLTEFLNNNQNIHCLSNFIVVDGFDRFNSMQLGLLKALTKHVEELYISFDYDEPGKNLFEEYGWKIRSKNEIDKLLADAFAISSVEGKVETQIGKACSNIESLAATDRLSEMEIIAARIKSAILFENIKTNEIIVTARNLDPYKSAIEAAFKEAGIDYHIDEPIALSKLPIIRFLLSLLSLAQNDFKRRQVIDCLRNPYFSISSFGLNDQHIELLNTLSLNKRVVAGRQQWNKCLANETTLARSVDNIFNVLSVPDSISSATAYVIWAEDLLEKVLDLTAINDHLDPVGTWKQKEALAQFKHQLAHLIKEEEIQTKLEKVKFGHNDKHKFDSSLIYEHLKQKIVNANFAPPAYNSSQVLITSAELAPNQKYKHVYLAGLLEGGFPAVKTSNGFLSPQELEHWRSIDVNLYNPRMEAGFEYALFASLVNRASDKLTLSYPTIEISSSKDELLPSFFFNALNINTENIKSLSINDSDKSPTSMRNLFANYFWQGEKVETIITVPINISAVNINNFADQLQDKLNFSEIRSNQQALSPVNGYLVDHVTASTVKISMPEYFNASQLNDYGKCPFNFWLTRMLNITPHEEPELGLSIQDRGTFYHKALELFYQRVIDYKITIGFNQKNKLQEIFAASLKEALDWLEKEPWFRVNEFWTQEKNTLAFRLNNFFEEEFNRYIAEMGQYQPYMVEAIFGPDNQYPALTLTKNGKTIKIRGKIDRIDIEKNSFGENRKLRLIDYKSGSAFISRDDFESGRNIQLPVYALAVEKSILPNSKVQGYQYLSIGTGKVLSAKRQDQLSVQDDLNILQDKVFAFVESIGKGDFSVKPSNDKVCLTCIHKTVCRVKEFPR